MRSTFKRWRSGGLGLLLALVLIGPLRADNVDPESVKAGFVYNFTKFVDWPAGALPAGVGMQLCVAGNALSGKLGSLNGRVSQGREIRVRNLGAGADLSACHILFIAASEERRMTSLLNAAGGSPVLTISDIAEFAEYGGMIGLSVRGDKVVFTINLPVARAVGLMPRSQLLQLGRVLQ